MIDAIIHEYSSGSHSSAWAKLASVRLSELSAGESAQFVEFVHGIMNVIGDNIRTLHGRLKAEGYAFLFGDNAVVPSSSATLESLARVESEIGKVPLLLRCFYEVFESVNFLQDASQAVDPQSKFPHFGMYCNLILAAPSYSLERWKKTNELAVDPEYLAVLGRTEPLPVDRRVETGPVFSSGETAGFFVPSDVVDSEYHPDLVTRKPVLFLDELRKAIRFAGFGNFAGLPEDDPKRILAIELSREIQPF